MKTLKDFEMDIGCLDCHQEYTDNEEYVPVMEGYSKDLKQEAIKWVKSKNTGGFSFIIDMFGKVEKFNHTKVKLNSIDYSNVGAMIEFINFFNLTEEELK